MAVEHTRAVVYGAVDDEYMHTMVYGAVDDMVVVHTRAQWVMVQ